MANENPLPDPVPRLRSAIVRRIAEAVRRLASRPQSIAPSTELAGLEKALKCRTAALERHVLSSRSAEGRAHEERDTLSSILELLDRAIGLARTQGGSEHLGSVAVVLGMTRSHIGIELEDAEMRLRDLRRLGGFLETGAANSLAATSLAPNAAATGHVEWSVRTCRPAGRVEFNGDSVRYVLNISGKVRPGSADKTGET